MSTWTSVAKPTSDTFTIQNFPGVQIYDDATTTYDDSNSYYDTINYNAWTLPENPSVAWNLARAAKVAQFVTTTQTSRPECLFFSDDGSIMYTSDGNLGKLLYQYALSTPWDVTTATFTKSADLSAQVTGYADSIYFRSDGLKLYVSDSTAFRYVEYDLTTTWDIATLVFVQKVPNGPVGSLITSVGGIYFTGDGLSLYAGSYATGKLYKYGLSIAWNVSTAIMTNSVTLSSSTQPDGIFFKEDGSKLYVVSSGGASKITEYNLIMPWDISTLTFVKTLAIAATDVDSFAIFFRNDGLRCYVVIATLPGIYQYDFSEQYSYVAKPM